MQDATSAWSIGCLMVLVSACSSGNQPDSGRSTEGVCSPGTIVSCFCSIGFTGTKACLRDRTYGICQCSEVYDGGIDASRNDARPASADAAGTDAPLRDSAANGDAGPAGGDGSGIDAFSADVMLDAGASGDAGPAGGDGSGADAPLDAGANGDALTRDVASDTGTMDVGGG